MAEQNDLFNYLDELKKPLPSNDEINIEAINSLLRITRNPTAKSSDVLNAAKVLLTCTGRLSDKGKINLGDELPIINVRFNGRD